MDSPETSERGLRRFEQIDGIAGRGWVDVAESSLATEPALWLTVRGPHFEAGAGPNAAGPMASVQLSVRAAHELANQLHNLAANHYQRVDE